MISIDLAGQNAVVFGVANKNSIAWSIVQKLSEAGVRLALPYLGEKLGDRVRKLAQELPQEPILVECDVTKEEQVEAVFERIAQEMGSLDMLVHSIAFANRSDLEGHFKDTSRDGYLLAMEISAFSLLRLMHHAEPLMSENGGSVIALTYMASQRTVGNYNVMGSAKAALEHAVRQLAYELGPKNIRVNAISAGPVNTLSARGIGGFKTMLEANAERACLKRNITVDEVGNAGLFLLSPMSSGITAETLYVDAGFNTVQLS